MHASFRTVRSIVVGLVVTSVVIFVAPMAASASTRVAPARALPRTAAASTTQLDGAATVETANKVSWSLIVSWNNLGAEPSLDMGLERVVTSPTSGFEFHDWIFDVNASSFTFNDKTGTLDSGTQANPVASVDLSFKTTSSKAATCTSGKETIYDGTLSGKVSLVTGLANGGTVSGTYNFNVVTPDVEVDQGCVAPATDECGASLLAASGNTSGPSLIAGSLSTGTTTAEQVVGVEEETDLASPKNATRSDVVALEDVSGKVFATYTGSEVKVASTGIVSGSATVSGGKPTKEPPTTCKWDGTTYKDTTVIDEPANYAGKFSATPSIGKTLTVPSSTKTGFYLDTTSKKT
jgi:hypothetical protein